MSEGSLTQKEKELIACGASLTASCRKCAIYHFKRAFKQGATKEEVQMAVDAATCVVYSSHEIMQRKAFSLMKIKREDIPETCTDKNDRMPVLIKIAAAVAANNTNNIEKYIAAAKELCASHREMTVAAKLGKVVLKKAGEFADQAIDKALIE